MASGFGRNKVGRCYSIFSTFEKCMNTEPDSTVCYDFRKQYFNCLHLPSVNTMSEKEMHFMEESKETLILASRALDSAAGGSSSPPQKPPEGDST
ncbi:unnamed protein product [Hapterophycus canaliculatus]